MSCATSGYEDSQYLLTSSIILEKMIELFKDCQCYELSPMKNGNDRGLTMDRILNNDLSDKLFQAAFSNRLVVLIFHGLVLSDKVKVVADVRMSSNYMV